MLRAADYSAISRPSQRNKYVTQNYVLYKHRGKSLP